jgi:cytidine deaminase
MYRAVADGKREFDAIAIIADTEEPFIPNGAVCQLLAEFDVQEIIMTNMDGVVKTAKLSDLLPNAKAPMDNALRPTEE